MILSKLTRLFNTIRFLKFTQVYYQIWYRIKNNFIINSRYTYFKNNNLHFLNCKTDKILYNNAGEFNGIDQFNFIGLAYQFKNKIDWDYLGLGKLWNYNLHYFNYLLDESISVEKRRNVIVGYSSLVLKDSIKLEPYPTSLRLINTILFISRHNLKDSEIVSCIKVQTDYLRNNLEVHILANHLLENIFSLLVASVALNDNSLFLHSYRLLKIQLDEQILADGAHYERSPMYHSIILGKLLLVLEIVIKHHKSEIEIIDYLTRIAKRMIGWINAFSFPDSSWALMNDATIKIAPTTGQLNLAASELNISGDKCVLASSDFRKLVQTYWEVLVNLGTINPSYQPGHSHSDILSFVLWYKGKQVFVDPGVSTYADTKQRLWERSTIAHNTVTINNKNQSDMWSIFRVGKRAHRTIIADTVNYLEAFHDGYNKTFRKTHKRCFKIISEKRIEVYDEIISSSSIETNNSARIYLDNSTEISSSFSSNQIVFENGIELLFEGLLEYNIVKYTQPIGYNTYLPSKFIEIKFLNKLTTIIKFK
jgi:hypothetical protein